MELENKGASVEIFVDDDKIVLKKYNPSCVFCGNASDVVYLKGKLVCRACIKDLSTL
jgi:transcriptional pleiotropic regulator of transition state genes